MYVLRALLAVLACLLLAQIGAAQRPNLDPDRPGDKPVPTVTFEFSFPGSIPAHYAVSVDSTGRAAYRSDDLGEQGVRQSQTGDPFIQKFTISDVTRTRILDLARTLHFFKGKFDSSRRNVASTGAKTLIYSEGYADSFGKPTNGVRNETTYDYSENAAIQQLTGIFQEISNTLELGRRIDYLRRFDRLGLDEVLRQGEDSARDKRLLELQAIAPQLQAVVSDPAVVNIARQRARRLLALANTPTSGGRRP